MRAVWAAGSEELLREVTASAADAMSITVLLCDDHPTSSQGLGALLGDEADDIEVVGIATGGAGASSWLSKSRDATEVADGVPDGLDIVSPAANCDGAPA